MNLKNLKIGTQLRIGFSAMLFFVIVLGAISYIQTNDMHQQIDTMYNHPLQVRKAIGDLKVDVVEIQRNMKDVFIVQNNKNIENNLNQIELLQANGFDQIEILYQRFLGKKVEVDTLKQQYILWTTLRHETIRMIHEGKMLEASNQTSSEGELGKQAEVVLKALDQIDDFAKQKAEKLYQTSSLLNQTLINQLLLIVFVIIVLSLIIYNFLFRNIRKPIDELKKASQRFHIGDMSSRSTYSSLNEFGELSNSFNIMVEGIHSNAILNEKIRNISNVMLNEDDAKKFFQKTILALSTETNSQMVAVYILSDNKQQFDLYESLGLNEYARQSFYANSLEGEFGKVLSSKKIQHISNIPEDSKFLFNSVSGTIIPKDILTIPIVSNNEVIAIISLASITPYSSISIQLIDKLLVTLYARIEGVLTFQKNLEFSKKLELQNRELESQKAELSAQSSELIEQNNELEIQKNQLNEASQLKTNFLSNMSHELRTPLNSVIALSGVLNRRLIDRIPEEEYSYLEVIERNGKHLLELINDILDISRIEAGREEIEITTFNTNSLITDVANLIRPQAKQKNVDLKFENTISEILLISDADKCKHILQNLIGNAVKFTETGMVEIQCITINNTLEIKIIDTGIGIAEENVPHIFDEFRQADGSTSRRFGGSGLGLAIAKKYANLLGGTITVKSQLEIGSEFTLVLPLVYSADNVIVEKLQHSIKSPIILEPIQKKVNNSTIKTILLVEDSEPAIIQLRDFLELSGYNILIARNGAEALQIISQTIPDAMILDLMMPGVDGFTVLETLRNEDRTAAIPVLILTAKHITKDDLKTLKRNNVHQLIQKGDVNRNELLSAIKSMVSHDIEETPKVQKVLPQIEGKPMVLVVEDNPDNMITVKAILADNYIVYEAIDGKSGIEMAMKHKPHLVLMDIALPGVDGIQAFREIRHNVHLSHIPIIALTASAMTSDRETILSHGFDAYLAKPINEKQFFKTINEILYGK